jgi:DsbC/DsbD-like thiol-disulfide interchange protein
VLVALFWWHIEQQRTVIGNGQPAIGGNFILQLACAPAATSKGKQRALWRWAIGHSAHHVQGRSQPDAFAHLIRIAAGVIAGVEHKAAAFFNGTAAQNNAFAVRVGQLFARLRGAELQFIEHISKTHCVEWAINDEPHCAFFTVSNDEDDALREIFIVHVRHGDEEVTFKRIHMTILGYQGPSSKHGLRETVRSWAPTSCLCFSMLSVLQWDMRPNVSLAFLLLAAPVIGAETPWIEIAPAVEMRLISDGSVDSAGKTWAGLELKMPQTTNTYWRVPGQAGFPAQFDFEKSQGVSGVTVHWPYPERKRIGALLDYVYHGDTVIPFEVDLADASGVLTLDFVLGICEEICIPAQASLELNLNTHQADRANAPRIKQALAEVPIAWDQNTPAVGAMTLSDDGKSVLIAGLAPEIDPDSVILDMGLSGPVFGEPQKSLEEPLVVLPILSKTDNSALEGQLVEVTFMTDQGAYAVRGMIEPATN